MSDHTVNQRRRNVLKLAIGTAVAAPLGGLMSSQTVLALDLPKVDPASPTAVGLKYQHDATKCPRVDKSGVSAAEQTCKNCQLAPSAEGEWLTCSLFPGKSVAAKGWCSAWVKRA